MTLLLSNASGNTVSLTPPRRIKIVSPAWLRTSVILDLSRFSAAPSARLGHLSFESDRAFPAQC